MGATHAFVRNDDIEGQGRDLLLFAQRIKLGKRELDRIYHEFVKLENPLTHHVEIEDIFTRSKTKMSLIDSLIFQFFDIEKSARLNFLEFLVIIWCFLAARDDDLAFLCFTIFDIHK
jgi:hypothetical protein